ncbi:DUF5686 and carboxypeptidase-like regulatory domain-containing protein [Mucilaginibacter myungsuensis]|uniref:Carboxypeptidase-like regulatory domain-containing protein n=1 Tax=Mucilaginibacter myungsuensis TaxID=649104 RepID=A0A929KVJ7_9SPHI|nr:DUF5686 and carboxypeptidase-like regulatory domain-containing protein [Mucilaginibacter myungsuensis]MBE9661228.1 carboxypeptidase-like regulatory domain-containing protein [Mucilaginibacter myungsuensis]MDN3597372.1 DUF5686 family protein [Mucilaginibacter myungsuensis]
MKKIYTHYKTLLIVLLSAFSLAASAQNPTVIKGVITDARTKETMPSVTVVFNGTTKGTSADIHGNYTLSATGDYKQIKVSFIGYKAVVRDIKPGETQTINIALQEDRRELSEVIVKSGKKEKYRNKGNPAVELIRQVIAHKEQNRMENYDHAEYKQYERMFFSLSNLSDNFKNKKMFKNYQFLFREQDSTAIGGKNLLPIYMEEKLSDNYFRKSPYSKKQVIQATKKVKYDENFVDNDGLATYFNRMYQDINIYDNNITLLNNQILSPIADGAPTFYKFFIVDTVKDVTPNLVQLAFTPRNTTDMLFEGSIYITLDGNYAVQNAVLGTNKNINLNFVRQMHATLSFEKNPDGRYHMSRSDLKMDFGLNKKKGGGIFGERVVTLTDYEINKERPTEIFKGPEQVIAANADGQDELFWTENRTDSLAALQANVYRDVDSLQRIPSFRRTMDLVTLGVAGYKNFRWFEVGPVNTFYNFNPVEGFRMRLGGRTTPELSKRYYFETYGAYGTRDQRWKYFVSSTYSLNNKSIYSFPQNYIRASYQHDTKIPGQELQFVQEDNFLLSFKRGDNDMWLYNNIFRFDHVREFSNHFSYSVGFKKWDQSAAGGLYFRSGVGTGGTNVNTIHTTEITTELRYAPKEKFYQGKIYRIPIPDKYPVYTLRYNQGLKGFLGGDYNYSNLTGNISKRFYLSQLGFADVSTEGGYLFGKVPFALMDIHRANQTYALQLRSYNLMNFLEFVSDHYAAVNIDQNFNGFFFNKVPLLRDLKLREVVSFKSLWGGVRAENNPLNDRSLLRFPVKGDGTPVTYTLNNGPYMEGSVGVGNIFKLLRVDLVRRFSYLDHANAPQYGVRALVVLQF